MVVSVLKELMEEFPYFEFIIGAMLVDGAIELYIDNRQRNNLKRTKCPEALKLLDFDDQKFAEANKYGKDKITFGLCKSVFTLVKDALLLFYFWWPLLWKLSIPVLEMMGLDESYHITHQLVYSVLEMIQMTVLGLPWGYYYDFVIEEKWGFNKKTQWIFWTDLVKYFFINILLSMPMYWVILTLIDWAGSLWYIYVWAFLSAFILVMMWVYPHFIQPCFDKVEPLEEGPVWDAIQRLARTVDYPLKGLYKIDGSKRSGHSNAYMYGFCGNKRIVLFDTIIEQMEVFELEAVLGHELGHWKYSHTVFGLINLEIKIFIGLFAIGFFLEDIRMYQAFGFDRKIMVVGLSFASMLFTPLNLVFKLLDNSLTRRWEFQADEFAVDLGHSKGLRSGLIKLGEENKSAMDPDWLYSTLNYSHPPLPERIRHIDEYTAAKEKKKD